MSMFARYSIQSSRERISPQAVQEMLELSRYSSLRRAASPERLGECKEMAVVSEM